MSEDRKSVLRELTKDDSYNKINREDRRGVHRWMYAFVA